MSRLQRVDALGGLMLGFMAERHRTLGPEASGLYEFYMERLLGAAPFIEYDLGLAEYLLKRCRGTETIVDIGAGIGQFSFLMAAQGFRCIALEEDEARFRAMADLKTALAYFDRAVAERVTPVFGEFPTAVEGIDHRPSVAVFACFVTTVTPAVEREMIRSARQFSSTILDLARFGRILRDRPKQQQDLLALFREEGFSEPETILDWGSGHFVRLRPDRSRKGF